MKKTVYKTLPDRVSVRDHLEKRDGDLAHILMGWLLYLRSKLTLQNEPKTFDWDDLDLLKIVLIELVLRILNFFCDACFQKYFEVETITKINLRLWDLL